MNNPVSFVDGNGEFVDPISVTVEVGAAVYIGGVVAIAAAGYVYTEATHPGTTKGIVDAIGTAVSKGVNDISGVFDSRGAVAEPGFYNRTSFASDATAHNVNMSDARQRCEQQTKKQDRKAPENKGFKKDGGNKEIRQALLRALTKTYGAREASKIINQKGMSDKLHDFQQAFKTGQNVLKEDIPQVIKEFRELIGK